MMSALELIQYLFLNSIGVYCPTKEVRRCLRNAIEEAYPDVDTYYINDTWSAQDYKYLVGSSNGNFALGRNRKKMISAQEFLDMITPQDEISPIALEDVL